MATNILFHQVILLQQLQPFIVKAT